MIRNILAEIGDILAELFGMWEIWIALAIIIFSGVVIVAVPSVSVTSILSSIMYFLSLTWWFWIFFILLPMAVSTWLFYRQSLFKQDIKWTLLEIRIPREVNKSPQAMEQVLKSIHSLRNAPGDPQETYWDGEVTRWYSLEMVSFGGEIRLFIRTYAKQRNLIEAAFFSYYPDVEIVEVEDYIKKFPQTIGELYGKNLDMWGAEIVLAREAAYPIRTYAHFESDVEEKNFDPISSFLETLGKIKGDETVAIHYLIAPADRAWRDKWEGVLEDLRRPPTVHLKGGEDDAGRESAVARTPGQTEILEAVEENLSKPAFDTLIRFAYFCPKESFSDNFPRRGVVGAFNQYAALHLNSFRQNYQMATRTRFWNWPHLFSKVRGEMRKQRLLHLFLRRDVPPETWMGKFLTSHFFNFNFASSRFQMNVEGIATLFHPPTLVVLTAPHMKRVESKKAGPPAGLAIFGEESEIERFQ